ncbi:hypothetical protein M8C21_031023, partial [Ambrosia artemisiifolia]
CSLQLEYLQHKMLMAVCLSFEGHFKDSDRISISKLIKLISREVKEVIISFKNEKRRSHYDATALEGTGAVTVKESITFFLERIRFGLEAVWSSSGAICSAWKKRDALAIFEWSGESASMALKAAVWS